MAMTFRVKLDTLRETSGDRPPYDLSQSPSSNFPATRITWVPNNLLGNREITNDVEFTASGKEAIYIRDNLTTGPYAFIEYVSGTAL